MSNYKHSPFVLGLNTAVADGMLKSTEDIYREVGLNTGNLAFHYAIDQQFGPNLDVFDWNSPKISELTSERTGIIPCANQIGEHIDLLEAANSFSSISTRLVAIGLGAQSNIGGRIPQIPAGTIKWLEKIVSRSPSKFTNIAVRGEFTQKLLSNLGIQDAHILGCPSNFISLHSDIGRVVEKNFAKLERIAVTAGHPGWGDLAQIEQSLFRLAANTEGLYVAQSPLFMLKLLRGEKIPNSELNPYDLQLYRDYISPETPIHDFLRICRHVGYLPFDIPTWMEKYKKYDFVIGTRIHGVMIALQSGVPAMCIAHDSRTLELCETMGVPYVRHHQLPDDISIEWIEDNWQFSGIEFDKKRKMLLEKYSKFCENNNLVLSKKITLLASEMDKTVNNNVFVKISEKSKFNNFNFIRNPLKLVNKNYGLEEIFSFHDSYKRSNPLFYSDPFKIRDSNILSNFSGSKEYFCIKLNKNWILDGHRFFIDNNFNFFTDEIYQSSSDESLFLTDKDTSLFFDKQSNCFNLKNCNKEIIHLNGRVGIALSVEPSHWGSFLTRVVPKISLLKSQGCKKILVYCQHKSQKEMLHLLGWEDHQIIPHNPKIQYTFDEGVLPSSMCNDLYLNSIALSIISLLKPKLSIPTKRIFVSPPSPSASSNSRVCVNLEKIEFIAEKLNFDIVSPDRLSLIEQIEIYNSAHLVVGPSGAGMFNTVFCQPDSMVVSIESELDWIHGHSNLFSSSFLRYGFIFAKPISNYQPPHRPYEINEDGFFHEISKII